MAQVNVKIKDIQTIHTNTKKRLAQPLIEVTLECNKVGQTEKHEIKFSEMLSNLADKTNEELLDFVERLVRSYVETAYKSQRAIDPGTGDWNKTSLAVGKELIVEVGG
ncbi:hypothetical protein ES708_18170 [subsurface metagenome]